MSSNPIKDVEKFVKDPKRGLVTAINAPIGLTKEAIGFVGNELKLAAERSMPDEPSLEQQQSAPTIDDASVKQAAEAEALRNRKGRASTILTGGSNMLSGGGGNSARRTLIGS